MKTLFILLFLASCSTYKVFREDHIHVRKVTIQEKASGVDLLELASLYSIYDCSQLKGNAVIPMYSQLEKKSVTIYYSCEMSDEAAIMKMKEEELAFCRRNKSELMASHCDEVVDHQLVVSN